MPQPKPLWMKRPCCPGLWVCKFKSGYSAFEYTQGDIDKWEWTSIKYVYGPVPEHKKPEGDNGEA